MSLTSKRPNRRQLLKLGALSATALAMPAVITSRANAMTPVTMQFDWKFNVQFAGLFAAKEAGLFEAAGIDVTFKEWENGINVVDMAAEAEADNVFSCAEQNLIIAAQAEGKPVKTLATMFQASPYGLMTGPDTPLASLDDLKGASIGVHVDGVKVMALVKGVNGIADDDIGIVEIPYEGKFDKALSGELYAVQCYTVDEPVGVAGTYDVTPNVFRLSDAGFRSTAQTIVASDAMIADKPELVSAFLKATFDGWRLALADVPGTAELVATKYAVPGSKYTDVAYQAASLALVKDYVELGLTPETIGQIDTAAYTRAAELMLEYGIVEQLPNIADTLSVEML
ncbi:MAG: ABC transporter substrate-binding protein [Pseudomonadota bacterium]